VQLVRLAAAVADLQEAVQEAQHHQGAREQRLPGVVGRLPAIGMDRLRRVIGVGGAGLRPRLRHRTSNQVDRLMNRLYRVLYAGRGLHGHQASCERRLRGWALLLNFRPFAPRGGPPRKHHSPAHRLNDKQYHDHWLHNLQISASLCGFRAGT
jgi:hypothetical protein